MKSFPQHPPHQMSWEALAEEIEVLRMFNNLSGYHLDRLTNLQSEMDRRIEGRPLTASTVIGSEITKVQALFDELSRQERDCDWGAVIPLKLENDATAAWGEIKLRLEDLYE